MKLAVGKDLLQNNHHQNGQKLATNKRDVLERGVKPFPALKGNFTHVSGAGTVFSSNRKPLEQTSQ